MFFYNLLLVIFRKADLLIIAVTGWTLAEILSSANLFLQFLILFATLIGVIWRTYKTIKK